VNNEYNEISQMKLMTGRTTAEVKRVRDNVDRNIEDIHIT
jgi:hypothetical protein